MLKDLFRIFLSVALALPLNAQTLSLSDKSEFASQQGQGLTTVTSSDTVTALLSVNVSADETGEEQIPANAPVKFLIQLVLLLVIIFFGIKFGGVSLGLLGGLGVAVLVLFFRDTPGSPPVSVMLIILAVVTTSSTLEATGALDLIVSAVERMLRRNPKYIVYLAPISTFLLTMLVGTGHAVYPLFPVIYDVAYKQKIRPERPMAVASVASQMGITASPIAAATAAMIGTALAAGVEIGLIDILRVTIPACFIGMMLSATWSLNRGKDLEKDPAYLKKMDDPQMREYIISREPQKEQRSSKQAHTALFLFLSGILLIIVIALFPAQILPVGSDGKPLAMTVVLQFIMLAVGAAILFCTRISGKIISDTKVFNAGMIALVMIFGIAWMSETVIKNNEAYLLSIISLYVENHPWTFSIAMFCISIFLKSQAATILVMMPLGFMLHIPTEILIGCMPASYAYFFFCFYPSDLAAISFDRTGTTHAGKYILNHSFMIPGLIGTIAATIIGLLLAVYVY